MSYKEFAAGYRSAEPDVTEEKIQEAF